jgi:Flp pilus assembly protein TadD
MTYPTQFRLPIVLLVSVVVVLSSGCAASWKMGRGPDSPPVQKPEERPEIESVKREPLTFEDEMKLADGLRDAGQLPQAAWHYIRGMQLDELSPIPRQRLGYMQLSRDVERAEKIFEQFVDEHPELASGHLGLGLARIAVAKYSEARASLEKALEIDPTSGFAHMGLGVIEDRLGRHEQARVHYRRASEYAPQRAEIRNNLGMSHLISGNFGQAAAAFRNAIFLDPRDPAFGNNLAVAKARQRDYKRALELFRKNSSEADALNNLGYVCLMNGDYERAITYFEHSLLDEEGPTARKSVLVNLRTAEDALLAQ